MNSDKPEEATPPTGQEPAQASDPDRASVPDEATDPMIRIDVEPPVFAVAVETPVADPVGDSSPPLSRKLAPPPKPRRDSGVASRPPPAGPSGELSDPLASSGALKAPLTPSISYSGLADVTPAGSSGVADPPSSPLPALVPTSAPPMPPRRASPVVGEETEITSVIGRTPSDPGLGAVPSRPAGSSPRPVSLSPPPRLASDLPPAFSAAPEHSSAPSSFSSPPASVAPTSPLSSPPASAAPPSSSAIFAMRIIAVGDPTKPAPVASEPASESDPHAYPESTSRIGVRRSSRPKMAAVLAPEVATDTPPAVESVPPNTPPLAALVAEAMGAPELASRPTPSSPLAVASPRDRGAEELSDDDVSPDSLANHSANSEADDAERAEAISVPPEELSTFQAEAKADAGKPPPPPKRAPGTMPSVAPLEPASPTSAVSPPPTPDLAAAKAAQRKNTRAPWWEDLFNEDFMRASSRVSDEQVRREVTFIEESLGVAAGGIVLDLGCGAGHHAVELASRGYGVVGYDLSLYQLALAADVAQERSQKINFLQGDMREMAFEEMFDGVFCWNTTFGYFEEDKNLAVAQRVFKALRPGGMFLIDVLNRDFAAASAPCTVWYEGDSCVCMDDMSVDYISSRLRVKRSIILDDGRTKESLFSLRLYSLHELGKLLHEVGFRVTEASGHPATPGVFFGPNSPRIIILAQRP